MKKIAIALVILVLLIVVLVIGSRGDEPLNPAVAKEMAFRIPATAPEDNAYVGLSGLGGRPGEDVVAAGLDYLKNGARSDSQPKSSLAPTYKNPCLEREGEPNCLERITAEAQTIDEAVQKNSELLARYGQVQKMPVFVNTTMNSFDPVPQFSKWLDASRLIGAKALLDIKMGEVDAGLTALEGDLNFTKMVCQSEHIGLIDLMIAVAGTANNIIEISQIIGDGQTDLSGREERLRNMLNLNWDTPRIMGAALQTEQRTMINTFANESSPDAFGMDGQESKLGDMFTSLLYKKNMTLNSMYARSDKDIRLVQAAPMLNFPEYYARHTAGGSNVESANDGNLEVKALYEKYGLFFFKNYIGEVILNIGHPDYIRYAARVNDTIVHSRLIMAQLELRLMADRPDDIAEALAKLGPETLNPYTDKPFNWDKERNVIWAETVTRSSKRIEAAVPPRK